MNTAPASPAAWWRTKFVDSVQHNTVIERVHEEASLSGHYIFMTVTSAGIAVLGLLLSSPAVVIGAMLISPLMGPIIGLGFAVALFDLIEIRRAVVTFVIGVLLAVGFSCLIVALSPIQTITSEIAARTRPNLFDLGVAVLSGLAGTYAMVRGRHGAIVGVAIAVALMPPLAVVGFGLATFNASIFWGASFLFFTNFMAICVSAAALARFYGFGHQLSPRQTWLQASFILAVFVALAVPLGIALRQIAWEAVATRQSQVIIARQFGGESRVGQVEVDYGADPLRVTATVFTSQQKPEAESAASQALSLALGRNVDLQLQQVQVGTDAVDSAQLAAARGGPGSGEARAVATQLALLAGAKSADVIVDANNRVAQVKARPLPGAAMGVYWELETRLRAQSDGWDPQLIPPLNAALPELSPTVELDSAEAGAVVATVAWAASRLSLPLTVSGARSADVVALLEEAGVAASAGGSRTGPTSFAWTLP